MFNRRRTCYRAPVLTERDAKKLARMVEATVRKIVGQEINALGFGVNVRLVKLEQRLLAALGERAEGEQAC